MRSLCSTFVLRFKVSPQTLSNAYASCQDIGADTVVEIPKHCRRKMYGTEPTLFPDFVMFLFSKGLETCRRFQFVVASAKVLAVKSGRAQINKKKVKGERERVYPNLRSHRGCRTRKSSSQKPGLSIVALSVEFIAISAEQCCLSLNFFSGFSFSHEHRLTVFHACSHFPGLLFKVVRQTILDEPQRMAFLEKL